MKHLVLATLALAACTPSPSSPSNSSASDPLAARYELRVDTATVPNVRSIRITGPDIELIEFRQGAVPNATTLTPGHVGRIKIDIATDWAAPETTVEAWRTSILSPNAAPASLRRTITVAITAPPGGGAPVAYAFQRCLPTTHMLDLGAQPSRIGQYWSVTCETVQRS